MSTESDVLADVFTLTQEIMKHQTRIDTTLKDIDLDLQDFGAIERASQEIIENCKRIEKCLTPSQNSCCCQT